MSVNGRLLGLLARDRIEYELVTHREAFTAQEIAQTTHIRGHRLAKVVLLRAGTGRYVMAVLPATTHVDLERLMRLTGHDHLELATEREVQRIFPDCEPGAMPPFGNLYGLPVYLDACLARQEHIVFQAGNHHEVVRMSFPEYERLAGPFAGVSCLHPEAAPNAD